MTDDPRTLISQARELAEKATPGPWVTDSYDPIVVEQAFEAPDPEGGLLFRIYSEGGHTADDAAFIAASRTLVPALADALEVMEKDRHLWRNRAVIAEEQLKGASVPSGYFIDGDGAAAALEAAEAKAKDYRTAIFLLMSDLSWAKGFLDGEHPRQFHSLDRATEILNRHEEEEQR